MVQTVVLALGGNALIRDRAHATVQDQYQTCVVTARHARCLLMDRRLVITHGNGPQVGFILRRSELSRHELHPVPLDSCVADTQGAIGYNLQMALGNELRRSGVSRAVVSVVTQTVVDPSDPAFQNPTKPIGSFMTRELALQRHEEDGWTVIEDAGRGYRRVVPSPVPLEIVELDAIVSLLETGAVVIAVGGGGVPVVRDRQGMLAGVEAVIDKDLGSSLLARSLGADLFIIATEVERVCLNYGKPNESPIDRMTVEQAERYAREGHFAPGSMLPKIKASLEFVAATGNPALITNPENVQRALDGETGTRIVRAD